LDAFICREEEQMQDVEMLTFPQLPLSIKQERELFEENQINEDFESDCQLNYADPSQNYSQKNESVFKQKVIQYKYCELCDTKVNAKSYFSHFKRHHCEALFVCDFDGKRFKLKNDLRDHMRVHIPNELRAKITCQICKSSFFSKSALKKHHDFFHSGYIEEHPCECGKIFGSQDKLKQHEINVHGNKRFKCDLCGRDYETERSLRRHRLVHSTGKVQCVVCGNFYSQSSMRDHLKVHEDPQLECQYGSCVRKFHTKTALDKHMNSHYTKSIKCVDCNSTFTNETSYFRHRNRQHSAKSICQVDGCDKEFSRKDNAIRHYKSHKDLDTFIINAFIEEVKTNKNISW
jgi:hypothetical protein